MGSRKVRKNEAPRRDERAPVSEKTRRRRTLRDLPDYTEPHDERATNPVIRFTQRVTALPPPLPPEDSAPDASLEALALLARRSSPPPRAHVVQRLVPPVAPSSMMPPLVAVAKPSSIPAMTVGGSSAPPARPSSTTLPPRRRASDTGGRGRALGTIVLSATVGAIVALGMWSLRSGLDRAARTADASRGITLGTASAVAGDNCPSPAGSSAAAPAAASPAAPSTVLAASSLESEPRPVSIDALPLAQGMSSVPAHTVRTAPRRSTSTVAARDFVASTSVEAPEPRPVVHRAAAAPVSPRAAVSNAVQRASFAARSCESGPQSGKVEVTFAPTGAVSSVVLVKGFGDVGVNGCVLRAFGRVRSATFEGDPITVRKTVSW